MNSISTVPTPPCWQECGLTGRSTGAPTAGHQARAAPWFIMHRAGLASSRRRPVNSALDSRELQPVLSAASSYGSLASLGTAYSPVGRSRGLAVGCCVLRRPLRWLPQLQSQSVGLRPRRSTCSAARHAPSRSAPQGGLRWSCQWGRPGRSTLPLQHACPAPCHQAGPAASPKPSARRLRRNRLPNPTFNRSSNGWPPCPRGARCLCCTSRASRPPVGARLTPR